MTLYQVLVESAEYLATTGDPEAAKLSRLLKLAIVQIDIRIPEQRAAYATIQSTLERERDMRKRVFRDRGSFRDEKVAEIDRALLALRQLTPMEAPDKTPQQGRLIE